MKKGFSFLTLMVVLAGVANAADWPQFCGPTRNNVSTETGLARRWSTKGPKELWAVDVTEGYAGPVIRNGNVYLLEHEEGKSRLRCLSFDSGEDLWSVEFKDPGELTDPKYSGTRGIPTVTEDFLYAVTLYGTVFCVDLSSHKLVWSHNMQRDYGKESDEWGFYQAPIVMDDLVIIAPLTESHGVMALHRKTGKTIWVNKDYFGNGFVSPSLIQINGEDQIVIVAGGEKPSRRTRRNPDGAEEPKESRPTVVFALSPKDGSLLWDYKGWSCHNPIPFPVVTGNNRLFVSSGYQAVSAMIEINGREVTELWKTEDAATCIEQPIFINNHLFVGGTTRDSDAGLICINLDGEVQWDTNQIKGAPRFNNLNMIAVDGMLIGLDGNTGMLYLIEPNPKKFNELASAKVVAEKDRPWAPIALSDGKLLVRDQRVMKCLNLK